MVVTDVHTFVGGPVSSFWLHGRDDGPAGSRAAGRPARRQYAEMIEFEVSGRNVDRALAPRGHFPGNEPVRVRVGVRVRARVRARVGVRIRVRVRVRVRLLEGE